MVVAGKVLRSIGHIVLAATLLGYPSTGNAATDMPTLEDYDTPVLVGVLFGQAVIAGGGLYTSASIIHDSTTTASISGPGAVSDARRRAGFAFGAVNLILGTQLLAASYNRDTPWSKSVAVFHLVVGAVAVLVGFADSLEDANAPRVTQPWPTAVPSTQMAPPLPTPDTTPKRPVTEREQCERRWTSTHIDVDVNNSSALAALRNIARRARLQLRTESEWDARISARLRRVRVSDAMAAIAQSADLIVQRRGCVVRVYAQ